MMCATSDSGVNDSPSDYGFQDSRAKVLAGLKVQESREDSEETQDSILTVAVAVSWLEVGVRSIKLRWCNKWLSVQAPAYPRTSILGRQFFEWKTVPY